jgi:deoxyribose-phosphate aldolase
MATPALDGRRLARIIDHTLLKAEATPEDVVALCDEALELGVAAVCVSPSYASLAVHHARGLPVAAVVGFPSGAHRPAAKAYEAALACEEGAAELDMVMDLGAAASGDWATVERDVAAVRDAARRPVVLKVILETALLDAEGIDAACGAAEAAGADFVKTSTGFHPAGGASVEAVRRMASAVGGRLGVKASGGIRSREQALAMVAAGATRLGVSATRAVLEGVDGPAGGGRSGVTAG